MPPANVTRLVANNAAQAVASFIELLALRGQIALYRGYIHEVNNALAGIGTLAEVLIDSKAENINDSMTANFRLMGNTVAKSSQLQRRMRAMYPYEPTLASGHDLAEYLQANIDLMELSLSRHQRLRVELEAPSLKISAPQEKVWQLVAVLLQWLGQTEGKGATWRQMEADTICLELADDTSEHQSDLEGHPWAEAIAECAQQIGLSAQLYPRRVLLRYA